MQLDAEEDENAFYKPPVEPAALAANEGAKQSQAAATITAEDDTDDD
jgi:sorting nexin-1/2